MLSINPAVLTVISMLDLFSDHFSYLCISRLVWGVMSISAGGRLFTRSKSDSLSDMGEGSK